MESKLEEKMEVMEGKMKENEDKEERLNAEKEQNQKEESRKEMEEKARHSNKQLKYTNIDLGGRITRRKAIVVVWATVHVRVKRREAGRGQQGSNL